MPVKSCLEAGCPNPSAYRGRCQFHSKQHDRSINRAGHDLYRTKKWQITRRRKLFEDPLCERCKAIATDVHHRISIDAGGAPHSMVNLESLCRSCHSRETRREQTA